jgi:hypothetical protein
MVGRQARIRVSSSISPFEFIGTLKSTLNSTRFPLTVSSITVFFRMVFLYPAVKYGQQFPVLCHWLLLYSGINMSGYFSFQRE